MGGRRSDHVVIGRRTLAAKKTTCALRRLIASGSNTINLTALEPGRFVDLDDCPRKRWT